jgi:hypothetical protein
MRSGGVLGGGGAAGDGVGGAGRGTASARLPERLRDRVRAGAFGRAATAGAGGATVARWLFADGRFVFALAGAAVAFLTAVRAGRFGAAGFWRVVVARDRCAGVAFRVAFLLATLAPALLFVAVLGVTGLRAGAAAFLRAGAFLALGLALTLAVVARAPARAFAAARVAGCFDFDALFFLLFCATRSPPRSLAVAKARKDGLPRHDGRS